MDALEGSVPGFHRTGDRMYHYTANDARDIAKLFDLVEVIVLR